MIKLGNEDHNLDHFLHPELFAQHPDQDCQEVLTTDVVSKPTRRETPTSSLASHAGKTTTKKEILDRLIEFNGEIQMTLKSPKLTPLFSVKDVDFFETEILRQFYINTRRVVDFEMLAYPEDRDKNNNFVPLHYHAVVKTNNYRKFIKVAPKKYRQVLISKLRYRPLFALPTKPIWFADINRELELTNPYRYEEYILKHYDYSTRLVDSKNFQQVSPFQR